MLLSLVSADASSTVVERVPNCFYLAPLSFRFEYACSHQLTLITGCALRCFQEIVVRSTLPSYFDPVEKTQPGHRRTWEKMRKIPSLHGIG